MNRLILASKLQSEFSMKWLFPIICLVPICAHGSPVVVPSGTGDFLGQADFNGTIDFQPGFATSLPDQTFASPTVTEAVGSTPSNITFDLQYSETATSTTGGASATATVSLDFGTTPRGIAFTNVNIFLSQSNPNSIALQPATLDFSNNNLGTGISFSPAGNSVVDTTAYVNTSAAGNVGGNVGDFVSFTNLYAGIDVTQSDHTLNSNAFFPVNQSQDLPLYPDRGTNVNYDLGLQVEDPGGTAEMTLTGGIGSSTTAVPEPASAGLTLLATCVALWRRR